MDSIIPLALRLYHLPDGPHSGGPPLFQPPEVTPVIESLTEFPAKQADLTALEPGEGGLMAQVRTLEAVKAAVGKEFDKEIALLRRKQNARLPIFRLSAELLASIFQSVLPSYEDGLQTTTYPPRPLPTTQYPNSLGRLILVCHGWRKIILDSPTLWTVFPCKDQLHPMYVTEALRLSRLMPLDVAFTFGPISPWTLHHSFETLRQESFRWRRLAINYDGPLCNLEFLEEVSAPELENFHLSPNPLTADENAMRPLNIFSGSPLPKLRTFGLSGISIRWELGQLAGGALRNLYLSRIRTHAPSVTQILDVVRLSPLLETLSLHAVPLVTENVADLPKVLAPSIITVILERLPSAALRQLVPRIQPPSRRVNFIVEHAPTMEEAPDFFAPGHESVLESILRGRNGKPIHVHYKEGSIKVSNSISSYLRIFGPAADQGLEWVRDCLECPTEATRGEVFLEISYLKNPHHGPIPQKFQTLCRIPNVETLKLYTKRDEWEGAAILLRLLSSPFRDLASGEEYWGLSELRHASLIGAFSIIPTFTQMARARLDAAKTPKGQSSLRRHPLPIKDVWLGYHKSDSFNQSEIDELQDILERGRLDVDERSESGQD